MQRPLTTQAIIEKGFPLFNRPRPVSTIQHPTAHQLYNYLLGEIFLPGAEGEVFLPLNNNPLYNFRGAGRLAGTLSVLQPAQVRVPFMIGQAGIPTIAGQIIQQPLMTPDNGDTGS